jgi:ribosome-binding protein aMBF1 (putative translation factor)
MSDHKNFISVSDLAKKIGKSESTIKRLAVKLRNIEPLAIKVLGKKIYINTDYLHLVVGITDRPTTDQEQPKTDNDRPTSDQLTKVMQNTIEILERELAAKNWQIEQLTNTVENLTNTTDLQNKLMTKLAYQISSPGENKRTWWQFWRKK